MNGTGVVVKNGGDERNSGWEEKMIKRVGREDLRVRRAGSETLEGFEHGLLKRCQLRVERRLK